MVAAFGGPVPLLFTLLLLAGSLLACNKEEVDSCEIVATEWEAELSAVTACEEDTDCGLPLPGTSQHDFCRAVQSYDADNEQLYYILQLGDDLGCTLVQDDPEPCPEASGFICDDGVCGWDYVGAVE